MTPAARSPLRQLMDYLRGYKFPLAMNILCNILMAVCMVISIPIIIPFFQILFGRVQPSAEPVAFSVNNIQSWLEYVFGKLVAIYSQEGALVIVCITFVAIFFLKTCSAIYRLCLWHRCEMALSGMCAIRSMKNICTCRLLFLQKARKVTCSRA